MAIKNYFPAQSPYFEIVFQDEDILVLNKASGLLTVPGKALEHRDSLQYRVQRVFPTATIVHRLDMATSGLLIMALHKDSHRHLSKSFEKRDTAKTYIARVFGQVKQPQGSIEHPLICDWPNRPKQMVDYQRGKAALTHYRVIQQDEQESLVELTPVTGRSHQLRVHMLSIGHPILGDRLYAHPEALNAASRLQLHAEKLQIPHPQTEQNMNFISPCPFSFKSESSSTDNLQCEHI